MIRFIHTADIHFGMENYGRVDAQTGIHSRLLDFNRALNACIDVAIDRNVDFFLFAGDAYKTPHPTQTQQKLLMQCFLRLHKANIPVVIVVGNHDHPLSFGKANALDLFGELPVNGFHVIAKPTSLKLETKSGPIQIVGIPWPTRNTVAIGNTHLYKSPAELTTYIAQAVARIIEDHAQQLDPTIPSVLCGHLTVSNGIFSGSEKRAVYGTDPVLLPSQLAIKPFDYVALGHLHRYQDLHKNGYPSVVYSGSIERVDFGERKEDKGFCLVSIPEKGTCSHEFIQSPMRPFIQIEVKLKEGERQTERVIEEIAKHNLAGAIVKVIYHVPATKRDAVDLIQVQRACADALHLVSVTPIRTAHIRDRRIGASACHMSLEALLSNYFESKPDLQDHAETLIKKTLELARECQEEERES